MLLQSGRHAGHDFRAGGEIGVCGTCIDARGISETELVKDAARSAIDELSAWTQWSDKVIVF